MLQRYVEQVHVVLTPPAVGSRARYRWATAARTAVYGTLIMNTGASFTLSRRAL